MCPPDAFKDMEPDEQYFHEATGNEGASFARTYRRAALVLWPRERWLAVLNQAGLPVTLPYLAELTEQWAESGDRPAPRRCGSRRTNSPGICCATGKGNPGITSQGHSDSDAAQMLRLLTRLRDTQRIDAFLADNLRARSVWEGRQRGLA